MKRNTRINLKSIMKSVEKGDDSNKRTAQLTVDGKSVDILIKESLSFSERTMMVNDIFRLLMKAKEDNGGIVAQSVRKLIYDSAILAYFTNLNISKDPDTLAEFFARSNIVEIIQEVAGTKTIVHIIEEVEDLEAQLQKKKEAANSLGFADMLSDLMSEIMAEINKIDADQIKGWIDENLPELKEEIFKNSSEAIADVKKK